MPTGKNWFVFIYINLAFLILLSSVYLLLTINNIQQNWSTYRCDALFMPFAGLIMQSTLPPNQTQSQYTQQNFQYCTQNIMSSSMGEYLQPLEYNNYAASVNAANTTNSINDARANSSNVRSSLNDITTSLGNVFTNASVNSTSTAAYNKSIASNTSATGTVISNNISQNMKAMNSAPKTL